MFAGLIVCTKVTRDTVLIYLPSQKHADLSSSADCRGAAAGCGKRVPQCW